MQMLIDNRDKYTIPQVANDYVAQHAPKPLSDVTNEAKLKDVKVTKNKS